MSVPGWWRHPQHRVVLRGVGANDEIDLGIVGDVVEGIGHRPGTKCCGQTGHGRGVAETRAVVNVVSPYHRPGEFLHDVVLLIGALGGAEHPDGVAAMLFFYLTQLADHQVQGLVPGGLDELAALLDQRPGQPVGVVGEVEAEAPFDAGPTVVGWPVPRRLHLDDAIVLDVQVKLAAHAAVGAGGLHVPELPLAPLALAFDGDQRAGGADLHAHPAELAGRILQAGVEGCADLAVEAAPEDADGLHAVHVVAGSHTQAAEDALVVVALDEGVRVVNGVGVPHRREAGLFDPQLVGQGLELAVAVHLAGHAIERVVGEEQLNHKAARLYHPGRVGLHLHSLGRFENA